MNKIHQFVLMGAFALALAFTFSCSSGDDDDNDKATPSSSSNGISSSSGGSTGGSYLSCSEAEPIFGDCGMQVLIGNPEFYACIMPCGEDDDACYDSCEAEFPSVRAEITQCFDENGFCGEGNSFNDACEEHYANECDFME